jgi:hypothetical protein
MNDQSVGREFQRIGGAHRGAQATQHTGVGVDRNHCASPGGAAGTIPIRMSPAAATFAPGNRSLTRPAGESRGATPDREPRTP